MIRSDFVTDVEAIRKRAREHIAEGAVTQNYGANLKTVLKILNDALATEIVCVLRYKRHHFMVKGVNSVSVANEFAEHALEEQEHADRIAARIVQLGGAPDLNPATLIDRSHSQYLPGTSLMDMVKENLVAERIAIDTYRDIIRYLGSDDPTTRKLLEDILENEEEHAEDLSNLLDHINSDGKNF
jgi:bacterioferritin